MSLSQRLTELDPLQNQMLQLFDDFEKGLWTPSTFLTTQQTQRQGPQTVRLQGFHMDMCENDNMLKLAAELPGVTKEDLDISVDGRVLTITSEKKLPQTEEGDKWIRTERIYGKIQRSIRFPEQADLDNIDAQFRDGVLMLTIPKRQGVTEKKKIQIA